MKGSSLSPGDDVEAGDCFVKSVPVTGLVVAQRVGRGIALLFYDHGTRRGWVSSSTPRPYLTPGKGPVPIVQEAGWTPGPVWTGGKSRPTGIRSRTVQPVVSHHTDWATRPMIPVYIMRFTWSKNNTAFCNYGLVSWRYRVSNYLLT